MNIPARDVESLLQKLNLDASAYQEVQADTQSQQAARRWPLFSAILMDSGKLPLPSVPVSTAPALKREASRDLPALILPLTRIRAAAASPLPQPVSQPVSQPFARPAVPAPVQAVPQPLSPQPPPSGIARPRSRTVVPTPASPEPASQPASQPAAQNLAAIFTRIARSAETSASDRRAATPLTSLFRRL